MNKQVSLGRTLIIVNPRARDGAGELVAERLQRFLGLYLHDVDSFDVVRTERARHAVELARGAIGYDTVLALGGDGVIHEVANGLMQLDERERPTLGLVPVGTGNDYARTLGIRDGAGRDFARLLTCERVGMDVGRITYVREAADPETGQTSTTTAQEHFVETFSIGLDAEIALGTDRLRARTGLQGHALYLASGLSVFGMRFRRFSLTLSSDGEPARDMRVIMMAVQIGPTYGSGFNICPDADPADGVFDICWADGAIRRPAALSLLLRARKGGHGRCEHVHFRRARCVELALDEPDFPIQADGERICARRIVLEVVPAALRVLRPVGR